MSSPIKPRRLRKLRIDEVSAVDRPANPHADILIMKRDATDFEKAGHVREVVRRYVAARAKEGAGRHPPDPRTGVTVAMQQQAGREAAMAVLRRAREAKARIDKSDDVSVLLTVPISKIDAPTRYIAGWASIASVNGEPVVDRQGDLIDADDLVAAAHDFIRQARVGKAMHRGAADQIEYTESIVFTADVQKALGIDLGKVGWWLGGFATPETFARIKSGELRSLSIAGHASLDDGE